MTSLFSEAFRFIRRLHTMPVAFCDRLHPLAVLALVAVVLGCGWPASVLLHAALTALVTALITLAQAVAVIAAAGLLVRAAVLAVARRAIAVQPGARPVGRAA